MGKRKNIQLISKVIREKERIFKECSVCTEVKDLEEYSRSRTGLGGRMARCKSCVSKFAKRYNKTDQTKNRVFTNCGRKYKKCRSCNEEKEVTEFIRHGSSYVSKCKPCYSQARRKGTGPVPINVVLVEGRDSKACRSCEEIKPLDEFSKNTGGKGIGGRRAKCKECMRAYWRDCRKEDGEIFNMRSRRWRLQNPEKQRVAQRRWRIDNKEKESLYRNRRKARNSCLRDDITAVQWQEILGYFENACALTYRKEDVTMDHFIPISTKKGGTYVGNVYPLTSTLNNSKHNRNPFKWFERYGRGHGVKDEEWKRLIGYLADQNQMSEEEFTVYVNKQFEEVSPSGQ